MRSRTIGISERSQRIPPFLVMDVLERALELAREDRDIIHLEVGEPDFDTPPNIVQAGMEALRAGKTHYTASTGIYELREAIASYHKNRFDVEVDPNCVVVTSGSSPAISAPSALHFAADTFCTPSSPSSIAAGNAPSFVIAASVSPGISFRNRLPDVFGHESRTRLFQNFHGQLRGSRCGVQRIIGRPGIPIVPVAQLRDILLFSHVLSRVPRRNKVTSGPPLSRFRRKPGSRRPRESLPRP